MMLLRTLVLEQSGHDTPVNGALLCCFAVPQLSSNYLAYSLDEEMEPGSARVYVAALRKKSERYFLGGIDSREHLQVAMQVFKQILTLAAGAPAKEGEGVGAPVPYHFIDLKGSKLPPARPEDHHSLMIKKALVMKVISLGTSVVGLPAIESVELIVPSIRFSSKMVAPLKAASLPDPDACASPEASQAPQIAAVAPRVADLPCTPEPAVQEVSVPPAGEAPAEQARSSVAAAREEQTSLFEVDSTLTNLARLAQELTQQKLAVLKQQEELEQLRSELLRDKAALEQSGQHTVEQDAALQQIARSLSEREDALGQSTQLQQAEQRRLEDWARQLESESFRLQAQDQQVRQQQAQLATGFVQVTGIRDTLQTLLAGLDQSLAGVAKQRHPDKAASEPTDA